MNTDTNQRLRRIRILLGIFIFFLVISGLTAFPLTWELKLLDQWVGVGSSFADVMPGLSNWITTVYQGLKETDEKYPFIAYGTDWLAFAHIVIAIAFYGPIKDPVRNKWVIDFGIIACILVIPLALICGPIREIPFGWRLIDCSFGVFGIIPLLFIRKNILLLEENK